MSVNGIFRAGLRIAEWATPHVKKWHNEKHINRNEGVRHLQARNYSEAEKYLNLALSEKHSPKHRAEILTHVATLYLKQNKLTSAHEAAAEAITLGDDPASQWDAVEVLAEIQAAQGNPAAGIQTLETMESTEKRQPQPDLKRLATSARQRGKFLHQSGNSQDALAALDQSLKLTEQAWGIDHLETAHSLSEVAAFHGLLGNHSEVQRLLGRALEIYKAKSGYHSEEASRSLHNLAISLEETGDYSAAAFEYERFVAASERQQGVDRSLLATAKVRLGALYLQAGRSAAARELLTPVVTQLEHAAPTPTFRDALAVLAAAEEDAGRAHEANRLRAKAEQLILV